ncbi:T9SS type A sorting domain-containing protein [Paracrocinitomix mangrovi]|uniref:T9SS type A sorting domain-containing protein n=1 Tax=Paracrocinitomix mangrovi TaxID=2862509 RepID=UPI001C8D0862|nr:T9SS type A sorting domain-containing protein [Paracrocinitomix mangrovi]UKN02340.1 T9SS type A sorting domain-containing protein [Paracrocinitomix mangrovi]
MKKILLIPSLLVVIGLNSELYAQTVVYTENFEAGNSFTLNTADVSSTSGTSGNNYWVVNNVFTGGSGTVNTCLGPFGFTVPGTPTQPAGIQNNPTSNYMHILSGAAVGNGILNASFMAADGFCTFNEYNFAAMSNDISTVGHDSIDFSFYWMCTGGAQSYGELYYSLNSGTSWTKVNVTPQYNLNGTWTQANVSIPEFAQQANIRFGFRFVNEVTFSTSEPSFSVDEISVTGYCLPSTSTITPVACSSYLSPSGNYTYTTTGVYYDTIPATSGCDSIITIDLTIEETFATITETACFEYTSPSGLYTWTSTGSYQDTITNTAGCDSILTIDLTINSLDNTVSVTGGTITANESAAVYQWLDCDNAYAQISGETNVSFSAITGNFAVEITANGCTDTSACTAIDISGLSEEYEHNFKMYPNPTNGVFTIDLGSISKKFDVVIYNALGEVVYKESFNNVDKSVIDLSAYLGLFVVELIDESGTINRNRIIIK